VYTSFMGKQDFGPNDLAASLVTIGNYLEGIATTTGLVYDPPAAYRSRIELLRQEPDYELAFTSQSPLVTIRVSSYNGYKDLIERCLPSIIAQTYANWEVIIVGDNDPQGEKITAHLEKLGDSRFTFVQREYRGPYPSDPRQAWLITGAYAFNVASSLANGLWTTKLDQDDAWEPNHLELLLASARKNKSEVVYGRVRCHFIDDGARPSQIVGEYPPQKGTFALTAALCHGKFKSFGMNELGYLWNDPGDWGLVWRLWLGGARFTFINEVVANVYIVKKENLGYYESQYRLLLETISKMQSTSSKGARKIIGGQGKIKSSNSRIINYLKNRFS
jgi:glycosyltransferase involved in cell wall biosynthesis